MLQKILTISKNASNKSCLTLNFLQKAQQTPISIFPISGTGGLQRFAVLKYYNAQEWECIFTLELNIVKDQY